MVRFLLLRLVSAVAVLLGVVTFTFALVHLGGDPLAGVLPPGRPPEEVAAARHRFGLDDPLPIQYARFLGRAARGEFGDSWTSREPALAAVVNRLPATLALTGAAVALALLVGVPLGVLGGVRPGGARDGVARGFALLGQAVPSFALGTALILVFAVRLEWLPASGTEAGARSVVLPALTLAAYPAATIARLLRVSVIEVLALDHVRTARGKGLAEAAVVRGHVLRHAALPTLAFVGVQFGFLLGGAVVVESVFAYPGLGRLALEATETRDLPAIQAFVVVLAALIVGVNLATDALARWLDPRVGIASTGGRG